MIHNGQLQPHLSVTFFLIKDAYSAIDQSIVMDAGFWSIFRQLDLTRASLKWVDGENMFHSSINQMIWWNTTKVNKLNVTFQYIQHFQFLSEDVEN